MTRPLSLLLVDDNPDDRALVIRELRKVLPDSQVDEASDADGFEALLAEGRRWDVAITDYRLRWSTGMDVFHRLRETYPDLPVIMFTASGDEELAVTALKQGVDDYITKTPKHYGRVPYAVQACTDRQQRRRQAEHASQALERSEALLNLALESVGIETWEYDLERRVLTLHGRAPRVFPGGQRELSADRLRGVMHPDDVERVRAEFLAAASGATRFESEFRLCVGENLRWMRAAGMADGGSRLVGVLEDITRRKRVEEQLREEDRQKDQFIATLGHELRNPLAPIRYAVQLLDERSDGARIMRARAVIERQAETMARLLDQLLDLSRIAHDRIVLERQSMDLRALLDDAGEDARLLTDASGQSLVLSVPDYEVVVDGDPIRLKQVVDNLVQNAVKFTPAGGRIEIALTTDDAVAELRVRDTGIGITGDMLERVFEPLVQADAGPASRVRGGLGIGLAVVRRLVGLHGGTVMASSLGPGHGATFTVRLPLAHAARDDAPHALEPDGTARRAWRVLVADDHADAAASLGLVLELHGHEVRTANDGLQAQAMAEHWRPDAMVLDIGMPGANGDEVARWVRAQPWGASVRLVAITGWGRPEDRLRLRDAGFDVHLVKPVALADLTASLDPAAT
ncbi:response regulator [Lysobacter korlensis]|uniref:histidine kinase n=1 Tax=Lysobacter korlensis TaxID=553636 RepID=A0ABV6RK19_9GAMM